jgi:hypothetical protein
VILGAVNEPGSSAKRAAELKPYVRLA